MDIANVIKELRASTGMTRKAFSEHTGIPVRTICTILPSAVHKNVECVFKHFKVILSALLSFASAFGSSC